MQLSKEVSTENPNSSLNKTAISISKQQLIFICLVVVLLLGACGVSIYGYHNAKNALLVSQQELENLERNNRSLMSTSETLQEDTADYASSLQELEEKTQELSEKLAELDTLKDELRTQLNYISDPTDENLVDLTSALLPSTPSTATEMVFLEKIYTPYQSISNLSKQIEDLEVQMESASAVFTNVAATTIERLSAYTDIPNGMPVEGDISTYYNPTGAGGERQHNGIDIATMSQVKGISATAAGTVLLSTFASGYGHYIVLDHGNGFTTLYAHNSANLVSEGDIVKKGDIIAMAGSSGNSTGIHCHYEIQLNGVLQDPMDYID
ncbi:peptidoglycan DD-metalloendopeptidase family protein [Chakrabartyella piscis]|uniref:peptidoglycan DD-metalloendopeptidase family protein n=1 Tax=Chakrabartyella piscis TaxID=2918914 RepID=UPI0029586FD1|nr:peptidoglycan DD-metalloendopeptidase family protein [Chakrabartyella piscis]